MLTALKQRARRLKSELTVLYHAYRDPRTPLAAKLVMVLVLAYPLSPIDLIPDFIPVLGYLDDLLLLPLGITLALRLVPPAVLAEHRAAAHERLARGSALGWAGLSLVVLAWLLVGIVMLRLAWRAVGG